MVLTYNTSCKIIQYPIVVGTSIQNTTYSGRNGDSGYIEHGSHHRSNTKPKGYAMDDSIYTYTLTNRDNGKVVINFLDYDLNKGSLIRVCVWFFIPLFLNTYTFVVTTLWL